MVNPYHLGRQAETLKFVTYSNEGYARAGFVANWLASLSRIGRRENAVVYTTSQEAKEVLLQQGGEDHVINVLNYHSTEGWSSFASDEFRSVTLGKLKLLSDLLALGEPVLFSDADIVFLQDPVPYLSAMKSNHPVVFQQDNRMGVEIEKVLICTGFFLAFPHSGLHRILDIKRNDTEKFRHDQELLQARIVENEEIGFELFPQGLFPNGSCLENTIPGNALILHYNFLFGNDKLYRIYKNRHWFVSKDYRVYLNQFKKDFQLRISRIRIGLGRYRQSWQGRS